MQYRTCNGKLLKYDQACVTVHNFQSNIIRLYNVSFECFECLPQLFRKLLPSTSESYVFSTTFPTVFQIQGRDLKFNSTFNFEEHVHYGVNVSKNVDFYVIEPPEEWRIETFSLLFLLALIFLSVLWSCFKDAIVKCFNSCRAPARAVPTPAYNEVSRSQDSSPLISPTSHVPELVLRNDSVDVFRGITIALMLFVNYGGGKFWFFEHSAWNGLTVADLVFPWFAWIMGVSVVLSVSSKLRQSVPRSSIFKKVLFRSLVLVALGISLNSYNDNNLHTLRIPGVLQRLGVAYFIVATLETTFLRPQSNFNPTGRLRYVDDLMNSWKQWTFMIFIVAFHSYLTFFVHYPNCPKGYIGPGGLHEKGTGTNCTGGAAGYIDRLVFGADHLYKHSTANKIYHITEHFDPEGLLGTLTTSFTVFLGANAGRILLYYNTIRGPPVRWMILSSIYGTFGVLLSNMFQEDGVIPINKNLWSLSFVFTTSCLAYFTLSVLYMVIDYFSVWKGNMFIQAGRNSILLYIGSEITRKAIPWNFSPISTYDHSSILLMNLWSTTLWLLIAVFLDDSKFYLKI